MNRSRIMAVLAGLVLFVMALSVLQPLFRGDPLEGQPAPQFTLPLGDGDSERIRLTDQRGKVVVLDFWASWCGPCRHSVPLLNRVVQRYRDQVTVLGINSEAISAAQVAFVALRWGIGYSVLRDAAMEAQMAYGVQAFPTLVLIDKQGKVAKVYQGEPLESALFDRIDRLIK